MKVHMGDSESWVSTEPSTQIRKEREKGSPSLYSTAKDLEDEGTFALLLPQNKYARDAISRLAAAEDEAFQHHKQFLRLDDRENPDVEDRQDCWIFSLGLLPEFPAIGWRIGKGRSHLPSHSVDILIHEGEGLAGVHARFCWVRGGGGFFVVADNLRGVPVVLNGEVLSGTQRLIPFRNNILLGECIFSVKFTKRSRDQEDQFQVELSEFYSRILRENAPLLLPTPSGNEVIMGDWIVRNPIGSGSFGRVSVVSHIKTGQSAAAKELWRTPRNFHNIDREVSIAKTLKNLTHARISYHSLYCLLILYTEETWNSL
jgi:hypothetical protein